MRKLALLAILMTVTALAGACRPVAPTPSAGLLPGFTGDKELATAALTAAPQSPTDPPASLPGDGNALSYPTIIVTLAPTLSPTPGITFVPTTTAGSLSEDGCTVPYPFARAWSASDTAQAALGCPTGLPYEATGAVQVFERGFMLWRSSDRRILVVADSGSWYLVPDTFVEGQMEEDPGINPPANRLEPIRGFGKVWRETPAIREALGWALAEEMYGSLKWLDFTGGMVVSDTAGLTYYALVRPSASATEGTHGGPVS